MEFMNIPKVPFTILALAPFCLAPDASVSQKIIPVAIGALDDALAAFGPNIWIPQPTEICPEGGVTFSPVRMKDITPDGLIRITPYLKDIYDAGEFIEKSVVSGKFPEEIAGHLKTVWPHLPLDLSLPVQGSQVQRRDVVDDILSMVAVPGQPVSGTAAGHMGPKAWKNRIDNLLTDLLENIYNSETFRAFEAAWRGVEAVVRQGPVREDGPVRLLIAPVSLDTLPAALEALVPELALDPPNLILIDIPFDNSPVCMELMEKVAIFAETLLAPVAIWITPNFFHLKSWGGLKKLPYLRNCLEDAVYAKWRKLREQAESRWLVVTCNRFLTRTPYGEDIRPRSVFFREKEPLWIGPVWALGGLAAQSTEIFGWPSRFTDYVKIQLGNLAIENIAGVEPASTEVVLPADRLRQFKEVGIMPLTGAERKDIAFMPQETTAAGESLSLQLFFSRITGFLMRCRGREYQISDGNDLEAHCGAALSAFFRQTGYEPPPDLIVQARQANPGEPVPLHITFTPPRAVLPVSRRIEFTFLW